MSGGLTVAAGEHGVVRVFTLDLPEEQCRFLREPGAAEQVLGCQGLVDAHIDVIRLDDLEDMGLVGYLTEGLGIPAEQVKPDVARLGQLGGYVLIVRSSAFGGAETVLAPIAGVQLFATYHEPGTDWSAAPMGAESAKPYSASKPSPRVARAEARKIGATLFGVIMAIILLFVLWIVL